MIFIIRDFAGHRPEVGVDIKEVHIDRYLDTVLLEILSLISPLYDHDFTISHRGHKSLITFWDIPVRNPVEPKNEEGENQQEQKYRDKCPKRMNEQYRQHGEHNTHCPVNRDRVLGIFIYNYSFHFLSVDNYRRSKIAR